MTTLPNAAVNSPVMENRHDIASGDNRGEGRIHGQKFCLVSGYSGASLCPCTLVALSL